jgi:hypothetical protein
MIADQAAINAAFDFRRQAMKPRPAKPSPIANPSPPRFDVLNLAA